MQTMIMDNLEKEKRDDFEDALWMTGEEAQAMATSIRERNRAVMASIGELG